MIYLFLISLYDQNHILYKPLIANLLGIDGSKIKRKYELDNEIESIEKDLIIKENDLGKL